MRLTAASRRGALTPALPVPYPALANAGLRLRHGQVSLTVAAPGAGKSMLWLNLAMRTPVRACYWSADTDSHDVLLRTTSLLTGVEAARIENDRADPAWVEYFDQHLAAGKHVDWVFDSTITSTLLAQRLNASAEMHGEYPALVVVDNLSNAVVSGEGELADQKAFIRDVQEIARETRAHIAVLAHAEGQYDDGSRPIPLSGVLNKLSKVPEIVLSLHRPNESGRELAVCVTKNRGGRADPAARHPVLFQIDFARSAVYGFERSAA